MPRKAPPARPPAPATAKRVGRPKGATPPPPVTGFRVPKELLDRLDAIAQRRERELAHLGANVSRNAIVVAALTEFCDREEHSPEKTPARAPA